MRFRNCRGKRCGKRGFAASPEQLTRGCSSVCSASWAAPSALTRRDAESLHPCPRKCRTSQRFVGVVPRHVQPECEGVPLPRRASQSLRRFAPFAAFPLLAAFAAPSRCGTDSRSNRAPESPPPTLRNPFHHAHLVGHQNHVETLRAVGEMLDHDRPRLTVEATVDERGQRLAIRARARLYVARHRL